MGLFEIKYGLQADALPAYLLAMMRSGACPSLLKGGCYEQGGRVTLRYRTDGLQPFAVRLSILEGRLSFTMLLAELRGCLESLVAAEEYLVPPSCLSFALNDLFTDSRGKVLFLLKPGGKSPFESMTGLLGEIGASYPQLNAELVNRRLFEAAGQGSLDGRQMLRLLSRWSLDLETG